MCCLFFKQKTAYELLISDWNSDVCSSDLGDDARRDAGGDRLLEQLGRAGARDEPADRRAFPCAARAVERDAPAPGYRLVGARRAPLLADRKDVGWGKSVSVSVSLGGRRCIKNKIKNKIQ